MLGDLLTSAFVKWIGSIVASLNSATDFFLLGLACIFVIAGAALFVSKYFFIPVSILALVRGTISVAVVVLAIALGLCVGVLCAGAVTFLKYGWDFMWDSGPSIMFWVLFFLFGGFGLISGVMFGLVLASLLWTAEKGN